MQKVGIVIICAIVASVATSVSPVIIRTKVIDVCHIYDKAGFPLSFVEVLRDQPQVERCLPFALSKAHPIYNIHNMAIDWVVYLILSVSVLAVISNKKRSAQPSAFPE